MHPNYHFDHDDGADDGFQDEDFSGRPSKTRLKKQMHDLQALGKELDEMPAHRLKAIVGIPESLLDALLDLKRIRSHEGRRRQLQYIGKIMRGIDAEPLREAVASFKLPGAKETLALHTAERWRDRLIAEDDAFTQWMGRAPRHRRTGAAHADPQRAQGPGRGCSRHRPGRRGSDRAQGPRLPRAVPADQVHAGRGRRRSRPGRRRRRPGRRR